jgi:GGDEF domain-containing protein
VALSLIAFDTDHIKSYVFATNRLTEIRGASSLLDNLNRIDMLRIAHNFKINGTSIKVTPVYTNGGSGLFVVTADKDTTKIFGQQVQQTYRKQSGGKASITFAIQQLPDSSEEVKMETLSQEDRKVLHKFPKEFHAILLRDLHHELELLRYSLREEKGSPSNVITLSSHPFMRPCDSCGTEYAEEPLQRDGQTEFYCASCREKQHEDSRIKRRIPAIIRRIQENMGRSEKKRKVIQESLWGRILTHLIDIGYPLPPDIRDLDRPSDFNEFRRFTKSKDYLGLIYADANNMGSAMEKLRRLIDIYRVANTIDDNIHRAMSRAIKQHLPIVEAKKEGKLIPLFPFDILLLGGDDIVMVTDAAKAMDVALTIAQEFRKLAEEQKAQGLIQEVYTLSIGVVLAPVKYPFGLIRAIAESALKFAKTEGAQARKRGEDDTRINFLTVTGGSVNDFKKVFNATYHKKNKVDQHLDTNEFYATLRPYNMKDLAALLDAIRAAKKLHLGRTKLHQLREAILEMNLTTAVSKGLALLSNWRSTERTFVAQRVYDFGGRSLPSSNSQHNQATLSFPRVTFPWFMNDDRNEDGQRVYCTPLLDFIELYDFVAAREGEASGNDE